MVGACQQNSVIFLVRGGGAGQEICGVRRRARCRWEPRLGPGGDAGDQITGAGSGLGTTRDRARCRRRPRLGPGRGADDQITGAGGNQINSKESAL